MIETKGTEITGTWTTERVEQLKSFLDAGLSCGQIAREIGVTRNAVIGKVSRLNLSRLKGPRERNAAPRAARPRIVTQHQILMSIRAQPAAQENLIDSRHRCSLLDLGQGKCRWPISEPGAQDFWFCGDKPVESLPYCAGHARIAYQSAARRGARR
jgi:GcrA cell cycle regulator